MPLSDSLAVAAAGMQVQGERLRVVSENLANADSTSQTAGGDPYRRKTVMFSSVLDKEAGVDTVKVTKHGSDPSDFIKKFDPNNPAADSSGYVMYPNVNPVVEMMDMREARRGYEANLDMVQVSKAMLADTIGLLK